MSSEGQDRTGEKKEEKDKGNSNNGDNKEQVRDNDLSTRKINQDTIRTIPEHYNTNSTPKETIMTPIMDSTTLTHRNLLLTATKTTHRNPRTVTTHTAVTFQLTATHIP